MKKTLFSTVLAVAIMFALPNCGSSKKKTTNNPTPDTNTTHTPDTNTTTTPEKNTTTTTTPTVLDTTSITTTDGKVIQVDRTTNGFVFKGYENKIVLLEVYGDTCPHCVAAIPSYNKLQAKYPNDVVIIALESYGTLTNASKQKYITVAKSNTGNMFSYIQSLTGYARQAVPYLMILARDGGYVYAEVLSEFPEETIESRIKSLL